MKQTKLQQENPVLERMFNEHITTSSKQEELEQAEFELKDFDTNKSVFRILVAAAIILIPLTEYLKHVNK